MTVESVHKRLIKIEVKRLDKMKLFVIILSNPYKAFWHLNIRTE